MGLSQCAAMFESLVSLLFPYPEERNLGCSHGETVAISSLRVFCFTAPLCVVVAAGCSLLMRLDSQFSRTNNSATSASTMGQRRRPSRLRFSDVTICSTLLTSCTDFSP